MLLLVVYSLEHFIAYLPEFFVLKREKLGYPSNFTIYDTDDAKSVIKSIVKGMNLDDKLYKPNIVYNRISAAKNSLYTWEDYQADSDIKNEDYQSKRTELGKIFEYYSKQCF